MLKRAAVVLGGAAVVATLWLSGCGRHPPEAAEPSDTSEPVGTMLLTTPPPAAALPAPQELTDVLGRLADPAVPGIDKLGLVEASSDADAATLDTFTKALQENHLVPLIFTASELAWTVDSPGYVIANVKVTSPDPHTGFTFPMEFASAHGAWQLSRDTADMLLAFGSPPRPARPESPPPPPPAPPPTR